MRRIIIMAVCVICAAVVISAGVYIASQPREKTEYVKVYQEESTFLKYYVEDDMVYIHYNVSLSNITKSDIKFNIYIYVPDEVEGGLLKLSMLQGEDPDTGAKEILIEGSSDDEEEHKVSREFVFKGEFGGTNELKSKDMPKAVIEFVSSGTPKPSAND